MQILILGCLLVTSPETALPPEKESQKDQKSPEIPELDRYPGKDIWKILRYLVLIASQQDPLKLIG